MIKILFLLIVSFSLNCNAQIINTKHPVKVYINGKYKSASNLKVTVISENDTIQCTFKDDKLTMPVLAENFSIQIKYKENEYTFADFQTGSIEDNYEMTFAIVSDLTKLQTVNSIYPNMYILKRSSKMVEVESLENVKEIDFLIFSAVVESNLLSKRVKGFSKSVVSKFEN